MLFFIEPRKFDIADIKCFTELKFFSLAIPQKLKKKKKHGMDRSRQAFRETQQLQPSSGRRLRIILRTQAFLSEPPQPQCPE